MKKFICSSFVIVTLTVLVASCLASQQEQSNDSPPNDFLRREHSFSKPYGGGSAIPFWDFVGSTIVTNKFVRLTADSQSLAGGIWNTVANEFKDWEMQFHFKVHGHGKDLFGDGFAMWYTQDRNQLGTMFGSKDYFRGLAIILDTYTNHNGAHNHQMPYISAMVNNGSLHYDHEKDGTPTNLAGCEIQMRNKDHDTYVAVRYQNYKLTVSMDVEGKMQWKECFAVENVRLPTRYHFGFSAATGDLSDNHDVISAKLYALDSPRRSESGDASMIEPDAVKVEPKKDETKNESSTTWYVFKIIFYTIIILVLSGLAIWMAYYFYNRQFHTKKRFY